MIKTLKMTSLDKVINGSCAFTCTTTFDNQADAVLKCIYDEPNLGGKDVQRILYGTDLVLWKVVGDTDWACQSISTQNKIIFNDEIGAQITAIADELTVFYNY